MEMEFHHQSADGKSTVEMRCLTTVEAGRQTESVRRQMSQVLGVSVTAEQVPVDYTYRATPAWVIQSCSTHELRWVSLKEALVLLPRVAHSQALSAHARVIRDVLEHKEAARSGVPACAGCLLDGTDHIDELDAQLSRLGLEMAEASGYEAFDQAA